MTDKSYSIIFSSPTGNTKLLADTIRDALPEENCNYRSERKRRYTIRHFIYRLLDG